MVYLAKKKSFWYAITHQDKLDRKGYLQLARKASLFVGAGFGVSLVVFIIIALIGGIGKVISIIISANLYIYLLAFVSVLGGYLLRFVKWNYYIKVTGLKVPIKKNLAVYLSLYSMNITPGKIGRVIAAYTLNRITKIRFVNIVPIVTMDIFTDFLGFAILALLAAIYFHRYITYIVIIDVVLLLPFAFILNDWLYNIIKNIFKKSRFIKTFTPYGEEYFHSQNKLNTSKVYLVSLIVTIPAALLNSLTLYFSLLAIGVIPYPAGTVFVYSSSLMFGMISAVPGNIGVEDGALVALTSSVFHLSTTISSAATIMSRFASLWFGIIIGAIFFFYTLRYWDPRIKEKKGKKAKLRRV